MWDIEKWFALFERTAKIVVRNVNIGTSCSSQPLQRCSISCQGFFQNQGCHRSNCIINSRTLITFTLIHFFIYITPEEENNYRDIISGEPKGQAVGPSRAVYWLEKVSSRNCLSVRSHCGGPSSCWKKTSWMCTVYESANNRSTTMQFTLLIVWSWRKEELSYFVIVRARHTFSLLLFLSYRMVCE